MVSQPIEFRESVEVDASPEVVWGLVADITRMGEWSPECVRAEWHEGWDTPVVGAEFSGTNRAGEFEWTVPCQVVASEPGRLFAFVAPTTLDDESHRSTWRYEFAPRDGGCTVTESFHAPMLNIEGTPANFEGRFEALCGAVSQTLANLKAAAEQ
jgi:uncharacterized protein YndB with AHSA1/START domain